MFWKKKNKVFIIRKFGENYKKIDEVGYKDEEDLVKYKKHQIPVPPKNPYTLFTDKINVIFFDLDTKEYIHFCKTELGLSTEFLEELFGEKMVKQLVKAVKKAEKDEKTNFDFIKTALIYGVIFVIGYLMGSGMLTDGI